MACRPNYAVKTRMLSFTGWKRFEMNETLKFHGVTRGSFIRVF